MRHKIIIEIEAEFATSKVNKTELTNMIRHELSYYFFVRSRENVKVRVASCVRILDKKGKVS